MAEEERDQPADEAVDPGSSSTSPTRPSARASRTHRPVGLSAGPGEQRHDEEPAEHAGLAHRSVRRSSRTTARQSTSATTAVTAAATHAASGTPGILAATPRASARVWAPHLRGITARQPLSCGVRTAVRGTVLTTAKEDTG